MAEEKSSSGFLSFLGSFGSGSAKTDLSSYMPNNQMLKSSAGLAQTLMNSNNFKSGVDTFVAAGSLFSSSITPVIPFNVNPVISENPEQPNPIEEEIKKPKVSAETTATEKTVESLFNQPIFRK